MKDKTKVKARMMPVRMTESDLAKLDLIRGPVSRSEQIRCLIRNARPPRLKTGSSEPVASGSL